MAAGSTQPNPHARAFCAFFEKLLTGEADFTATTEESEMAYGRLAMFSDTATVEQKLKFLDEIMVMIKDKIDQVEGAAAATDRLFAKLAEGMRR